MPMTARLAWRPKATEDVRVPASAEARARVTRGKTAQGRLRSLDVFLREREPHLLSAKRPLIVDVGLGYAPHTTLDSARYLGARARELRVIGVDIDAARVAAARRFVRESALERRAALEFRCGGFDLPLAPEERPTVIRAMNLLRQYRPETVDDAHARLSARLRPGGLLLEGSCDRHGGRLTAHLLRRGACPDDAALRREGLLFFTDFSRGFAPMMFRDFLPRDLRRRAAPGSSIRALLDRWTDAWRSVQGRSDISLQTCFSRSVALLRARAPTLGVAAAPALTARGYMLWRPPGGVPRAGA